ncbi:unnamed protein product [Caenorhabditis angaria]|uniref:Serpentine Receptor, class I n=1 Tax=Caenorhabditis angaria TaxID=860376 RepID=A0A9P1MW04_9PELO|nr:unnamed protein product [Caenorhabditis angaria]
MDLDCPHQAPTYYILCLHLIAAVSFTINSLGIYLVIYHSPNNSKYKFCQLYLQIVSMIVENYMSWVAPAYYYFPMIAGYNTSSFTSQFISTHTSVIFYFFVFCFELPSILSCFQFRNDSAAELSPKNRIPRSFSYFMNFLSHTFPFIVAFSVFKSTNTYQQQYIIVSQKFPKCLHLLYMDEFAVYDYDDNLWLAIAGIAVIGFISFFGIYVIFLVAHTILILSRMRRFMSPATFKLHKTTLFSLILQVMIPLSFVCVPLTVIFIVILEELTKYQELATDTMLLITSHSMISTIVMIACNNPYKSVIFSIISRILMIRNKTTDQTTVIEQTLTYVNHA